MIIGSGFAAALFLVLVNACFVAAEYSVVSVRRARIDAQCRHGSRRARILRTVLDDLDSHIAAGQLMITTAAIGIGWLGQPAVAAMLKPFFAAFDVNGGAVSEFVAYTVAFAGVTISTLVAGEITPKLLGLRRAERVALWTAPLLRMVAVFTRPILKPITASASTLLSLLGVKDRGDDLDLEGIGPDELHAAVRQSTSFGRLSFSKRRLLENALEFTERTAKQIMVPRDQIDYLNLELPLEQNLETVHGAGHTRYPLCRGTLDTVVGMLHIKDLFQKSGQVKASEDLRTIQHEMLFVPETQPIDILQRSFQRRRAHMAIVVDEYGVPTGLVTLEDVLEELVGEIQDEFDADEKPKIEESDEGLLVDGLLLVDDLCRELSIDLEPGEDDTVGGYVTTVLGKIARVDDSFRLADFEGKVVEMEGRRIARVLLSPAEEAENGDARVAS